MRKGKALVLVLLVLLLLPVTVFAEDDGYITEQLDIYDYTDIDGLLDEYGIDAGGSFGDVVVKIINGNYSISDSVTSNVFDIILPDMLRNYAPKLILFIILSLIISVCNNSVSSLSNKNAINIVGNSILVLTVFSTSAGLYMGAVQSIAKLSNLFEVALGPLTVALLAAGANSTSVALQPEFTFFTQFICGFMVKIVFPSLLILLVFTSAQAIGEERKTVDITAFVKSSVGWLLGLVFVIFGAYLAIKGIIISQHDGISVKALRYLISGSIPYAGSIAGEGINLFLSYASLIKSAMGVGITAIIVYILAYPLISIAVYYFLIRLAQVIISPFGISGSIYILKELSEICRLALAALFAILLCSIVIIGVIISAGGV